MTESDRERAYRVCAKALTSITQACAAIDIPFFAVLRTDKELQVYCADRGDVAELCALAAEGLEPVPSGATVN